MTELRDRINAYKDATNAFLISVNDVTPENIDISSPDGWSARQVIHHVADSETQSYTSTKNPRRARFNDQWIRRRSVGTHPNPWLPGSPDCEFPRGFHLGA